MAKGIKSMSAGKMYAAWLKDSKQLEKNWFMGILQNREGFAAWTSWFSRGMRAPGFLEQFDSLTDPWAKSRLVGERIREIRRTFRELTPAQREELSKDAEVELKAGLALLSRDKQMIRELLEIAEDPPPAQ